jgi:hypothetical protein
MTPLQELDSFIAKFSDEVVLTELGVFACLGLSRASAFALWLRAFNFCRSLRRHACLGRRLRRSCLCCQRVERVSMSAEDDGGLFKLGLRGELSPRAPVPAHRVPNRFDVGIELPVLRHS